jgi:hypothetical protein
MQSELDRSQKRLDEAMKRLENLPPPAIIFRPMEIPLPDITYCNPVPGGGTVCTGD